MDLTIIPLDVGAIQTDKSNLTPRRDYGTPVEAASIIWFIDASPNKIIVDTSFKSVAMSSRLHHPIKVERRPEQEILRALSAIGVKPEAIDIVVLTHLHWDHCQNNQLFANARFIVQREELRYAIAPLHFHAAMYEALTINMRPLWLDTPNIEVVDGDRAIAEGVSVIFTPGHTPGYQSVLVESNHGKIAIAGCMVPTFENWPGSQQEDYLPSSLYVNLEQYWESLRRMDRMADLILPGHDPGVFKKGKYP
jgi:glyoxylase-like metal-dependent hydrolase (beta-lactamase superfamily II)